MKFKTLPIVIVLLAVINLSSHSQKLLAVEECNFKLVIVKDRYLFGKAYLREENIKRMKVKFTSSVVNVRVPYGKKMILLAIQNTNCRAYCPRAKRIRQLNSGDERLLIKLLKKRKKSLLNQLGACNFR